MSSRFRVTTAPEALPGQCKICGSADKEWFLDTATSEEYWGAVYYCNECVAEMARVCGFETPEIVQVLRNINTGLEKSTESLLSENERLKALVDNYARTWLSLRTSPDAHLILGNKQSKQAISTSTDELGVGEGEGSESGNDEGVVVVPSNESSDEPTAEFNFSL